MRRRPLDVSWLRQVEEHSKDVGWGAYDAFGSTVTSAFVALTAGSVSGQMALPSIGLHKPMCLALVSHWIAIYRLAIQQCSSLTKPDSTIS